MDQVAAGEHAGAGGSWSTQIEDQEGEITRSAQEEDSDGGAAGEI